MEGLTRRYPPAGGDRPALRDVSFSIAPGECLALLGPNGAGKSTTINILATLIRADAGRAAAAGHDILRHPARARRVLGVALQTTGLPGRQTARSLLWYHARLQGLAPDQCQSRIVELVDAFKMNEFADRRLATYSGGELRRLDIALAMVHRPPVILLDEPTAGLDLDAQRLIWQQLELCLNSGSSLLLATHDLSEADSQAQQVAFIHSGKLVALSTPDDLKARHGARTIEVEFKTEGETSKAADLFSIIPKGLTLTFAAQDAGTLAVVVRQLTECGIAPQRISTEEPTLETVFNNLVRTI